MKYYTIRITELVKFGKGDQEIETFILMDAETDAELALLIATYILELKASNVYSDVVSEVHVGSKEMTREEFIICSAFINTYARGARVNDDDLNTGVDPAIIISNTIQ